MMTDGELLTVLKNLLGDSIKYANKDFEKANAALDKAYRQELYGNEEEGRSKVIASDVYDTVESDMPAFARIFLGSTDIMKFIPLTEADVDEAEQKTKYANYLIRGQKDSFKTLHDLLKEPGKAKCSVAYYRMEESETPRYVRYEGLTEEALTMTLQELEAEETADRVEVETQEQTKDEKFNVRFRVVTKRKKIAISAVPGESFILSRGATCKDTAMLVGHETTKSKGRLIAEGYPEELIKGLVPDGEDDSDDSKRRRFADKGGWDQASGYHWTNEEVTIQTLYALVDYDEDGIPERRMIVKCRETILEQEPYGHVPYAIFSQLLEPHSAIGNSRGEQASRFQLEKTAVKRGVMDNIYSVNRPALGVDDSDGSIDGGKTNLDDALSEQINRIIRTDGPPGEALLPIVTPYVGDKALQVIQYLDAEKSVTLGNQMANQGLDSDKLYKETATRFEGVQDAQEAKLELVARVYAETGFRELFEGVIWTAQHYQDDTAEFMVLGKQFSVDPKGWKYEHYCQSQVGLGAGDNEQIIANLGAVVQQQWQHIQSGSPLADWKKMYNALSKLMKAMGQPDPGEYFNDPEMPEEMLYARAMQLFSENSQLKQMVQNPLAQAEQVKAQGRLTEQHQKHQFEFQKFIMDLAQKDKQFWASLSQEQKEAAMSAALKATDLELTHSVDVPGAMV